MRAAGSRRHRRRVFASQLTVPSLADANLPAHGLNQLSRIVADAILEYRRHIPDDRRIRRKVPIQDDEVSVFADRNRSQLE